MFLYCLDGHLIPVEDGAGQGSFGSGFFKNSEKCLTLNYTLRKIDSSSAPFLLVGHQYLKDILTYKEEFDVLEQK
jgi:hypothetical protein